MEARVDDEDLREGVGQILGLAREVDDLADRPERRHRHEVGLHQAAGGLLRIKQVALQRSTVALRELVEDLLLVALLEAAQQVGRVVAVELGDGPGQHVVGQRLRDLVAHLLVDLGQHLEVEIGAQRLDDGDPLLRAQQLDQVGEVGAVHVGEQRAHLRLVVGLDRLGDGAHELGRRGAPALVRSDLLMHVAHGRALSWGTCRSRFPVVIKWATRL